MRLSDLLECEVVDREGTSWGQVHDALLLQDGPLQQSNQAAFRLHGLLAGPGSLGARLGYTDRRGYEKHQETKGPLPIKALMRHLHRDAVYIPWSAIARIEPGRIVVDAPEGGFPAT